MDIQHRVRENDFVTTAESLLDVTERYRTFIHSVRGKTEAFKDTLIIPTVNPVKKLIEDFKYDMNRVVFRGLNRAMNEIDIVFGPNRDTMEFFIGRVIRNTKIVSLHVNNLVQYDFKYAELESLLTETIQYASVCIKTLPRYYEMLISVPGTMTNLHFDFGKFIFPPLRLAKVGNFCRNEVDLFQNQTIRIHDSLQKLNNDITVWSGGQQQNDEISLTLKQLYIDIHDYHIRHTKLKEDCLQRFINKVTEIQKFNESYQADINTHTDLAYSFSFDEAESVLKDQSFFKMYVDNYLYNGNITKFELQDMFTEDLLNEFIAHGRDLVQKIRARLTERLRRRMDKARADITEWYITMVDRAHSMKNYLAINFLEERLRDMTIWKEPRAIVEQGAQQVIHYIGK